MMDSLGGHLLPDHFARQLLAGPYLPGDDDAPTPRKGPPQKPQPQRQMPPARPPMQVMPIPLIEQQEPLMPGEMPAQNVPGSNGRPPMLPRVPMPPRMPGVPNAPQMQHSPSLRSPLAPKMNSPAPSPGLNKPSHTPSLKSPTPVSHSPSNKSPSQQSSPKSKPSHSPAPMSLNAMAAYLNTADDESWGGHPLLNDPDWGSGSGTSHESQPYGIPQPGAGMGNPANSPAMVAGPRVADQGPDWQGGNPDAFDTDPLHSLSRKGYMFHRLTLQR